MAAAATAAARLSTMKSLLTVSLCFEGMHVNMVWQRYTAALLA